jgi:hypothetical protein
LDYDGLVSNVAFRRELTSAYRAQVAATAGVWPSNVTIMGIRAGSVLMDTAVDMSTGDDPAVFAAAVQGNPGAMFAGIFVFNGGDGAGKGAEAGEEGPGDGGQGLGDLGPRAVNDQSL